MASREDRVVSLFGRVAASGDALNDLEVYGVRGRWRLASIVDTALMAEIALPTPVIVQLGLAQQDFLPIRLADGSLRHVRTYSAAIQWVRGRRSVLALGDLGNDVLIGSALLAECRLTIDYPARTVEIARSSTVPV